MIQIPAYRTLRFKLFAFISILLMLAITVSSLQNSRSFHDMLMMRIQERALESATTAANSVAAVVEAWSSQLLMLTSSVSSVPAERHQAVVENLTSTNSDVLTLEVITLAKGGKLETYATAQANAKNDERLLGRDMQEVTAILRKITRKLIKAAPKNERFILSSLTKSTKLPLLLLAQSFKVDDSDSRAWGIMIVWQTKLVAALAGEAAIDVRVYNRQGDLLVASKADLMTQTAARVATPFPNALARQSAPKGFRQWTEGDQTILGAYAHVPALDLVAVTLSDAAPALEAVRIVMVRTALWALLLLLLAVLFSLVAASGITQNLAHLTRTTLAIASGQFQSKVPIRSRDEVGLLGVAVNHMGSQIEVLMREHAEKVRLESELHTAKLVQDCFFPARQTHDEHLHIVSFYQPASTCGGDWWMHYPLPNKVHLICIADATGHGVPAALVTAMAFAATSVLARRVNQSRHATISPAAFIEELNRTFCESGEGTHTMTFFVALLDMGRGTMTCANAGHNFPLLLRRDERGKMRRKSLGVAGTPLGFQMGSTYEQATLSMEPGDRLLFYTDGLFECTNAQGEAWGKRNFHRHVDRLATVKDLGQAKDELLGAAFHHFNGHPVEDDVTLVLLEIDQEWRAQGDTGRIKLPTAG